MHSVCGCDDTLSVARQLSEQELGFLKERSHFWTGRAIVLDQKNWLS
ncbi:hypothetical protein [Microcoleus sp. B5-D4]